MKTNWKILIVTSGQIFPEYYMKDSHFNNENYVFFNVSKSHIENDTFNIINTCDIPGYLYLGKDYAESEVIYNIYKLDLFKDVDYIGILHYDFNLYSPKYDTYRITDNISNILEKYDWISFFPATLGVITGHYDVLMDERKPNCLFVRESNLQDPKSCIRYIENLIGLDVSQYKNDTSISLCCSFICTENVFKTIGKLIADVIDRNIFQNFDTERRHRFPGQFMERLVAIYSMTQNKFSFQLDHRFIGGNLLNKTDPNGENY